MVSSDSILSETKLLLNNLKKNLEHNSLPSSLLRVKEKELSAFLKQDRSVLDPVHKNTYEVQDYSTNGKLQIYG